MGAPANSVNPSTYILGALRAGSVTKCVGGFDPLGGLVFRFNLVRMTSIVVDASMVLPNVAYCPMQYRQCLTTIVAFGSTWSKSDYKKRSEVDVLGDPIFVQCSCLLGAHPGKRNGKSTHPS